MRFFQCLGCHHAPCLHGTLDQEVDGDDLACMRRVLNYIPVWRELVVKEE